MVNPYGSGQGSFRQAIRDLNASGGGIFRFSNVTGNMSLPLGLPPLQAYFRIRGSGWSNLLLTIPPGTNAFVINLGTTGIISGMTIQSRQPLSRGGGAISNAGNLALQGIRFVDCQASNGGAIYNLGRLQATDRSFVSNSACNGGAILQSGQYVTCRLGFYG